MFIKQDTVSRDVWHVSSALIIVSQISSMVEALLYVRSNENTSRVAFIHAYDLIEDIPSVKSFRKAADDCVSSAPLRSGRSW